MTPDRGGDNLQYLKRLSEGSLFLLDSLSSGRSYRGIPMNNNDILRRLRYALNLNATAMSEICALAGVRVSPTEVLKLLKKEDENGFAVCDDPLLSAFLDGLIIHRRGPREPGAGPAAVPGCVLTNNMILPWVGPADIGYDGEHHVIYPEMEKDFMDF